MSCYFNLLYVGEDVVFVANDWHTSLIPCYLKTMYKPKGMYKSAKVSAYEKYFKKPLACA